MKDKSYVYIMTTRTNSVLYIGVTSNLDKRIIQHKFYLMKGFTDKYNCIKIVYFEEYGDINTAINREKQLKNWHRQWKIKLINKKNPNWIDLSTV